MDTIRVRTTQNVFIEYPIASLGDRMLAFLIDAVVITAYMILCYFAIGDYFDNVTVNILIIFLPFFLYHLLFEIFMNGQSPGKRQMKIKVVNLDGSAPTMGGYFLRWLFRLVEIVTLRGAIAMIAIAANGKGQRLGDIAAGTTVVKLVPMENATSGNVFAIAEEGHVPTFAGAAALSDDDIETIHQALAVYRTTGNMKPVDMLTAKLKSLLNVESDLAPVKFLYTVIEDHSQLVSAT